MCEPVQTHTLTKIKYKRRKGKAKHSERNSSKGGLEDALEGMRAGWELMAAQDKSSGLHRGPSGACLQNNNHTKRNTPMHTDSKAWVREVSEALGSSQAQPKATAKKQKSTGLG